MEMYGLAHRDVQDLVTEAGCRLIEVDQQVLGHGYEKLSPLRRAAYAVWEPILCFVLLPFRLPSPPGRAIEPPRVVERTAEYDEAAERYFTEHPDPSWLLAKPLSDTGQFARHLVYAGS